MKYLAIISLTLLLLVSIYRQLFAAGQPDEPGKIIEISMYDEAANNGISWTGPKHDNHLAYYWERSTNGDAFFLQAKRLDDILNYSTATETQRTINISNWDYSINYYVCVTPINYL